MYLHLYIALSPSHKIAQHRNTRRHFHSKGKYKYCFFTRYTMIQKLAICSKNKSSLNTYLPVYRTHARFTRGSISFLSIYLCFLSGGISLKFGGISLILWYFWETLETQKLFIHLYVCFCLFCRTFRSFWNIVRCPSP